MLCIVLKVSAHSLHISGTLNGTIPPDFELYVAPLTDGEQSVKAIVSGTTFSADVAADGNGLYSLTGILDGRQLTLPLYVSSKKRKASVTLSLEGISPFVSNNAENRALSAFNQVVYERGRYFWTQAGAMSDTAIRAFMPCYTQAADSIIAVCKPCDVVGRYITLWGYVQTCSLLESAPRVTHRSLQQMGIQRSVYVQPAYEVLDTPLASTFPGVARYVAQDAPRSGSLCDRLAYVRAHYCCVEVRDAAVQYICSTYVRTFDYASDYDAGLAQLERAVKDYGADESLIADFKARRAALPGAAFPASVKLKDLKGNTVEFARYHGKYVYVDLWASWCQPCRREIPYLQALEKSLSRKDVVFVSISVDSSADAWNAAASELKLSGQQLMDAGGVLCDILNVTGIPHFLVYDKEGKLCRYNAPRPSNLEEITAMFAELK